MAATEGERDSVSASVREWQVRLAELTRPNERLAGNVIRLETKLISVKMQLAHKEQERDSILSRTNKLTEHLTATQAGLAARTDRLIRVIWPDNMNDKMDVNDMNLHLNVLMCHADRRKCVRQDIHISVDANGKCKNM